MRAEDRRVWGVENARLREEMAELRKSSSSNNSFKDTFDAVSSYDSSDNTLPDDDSLKGYDCRSYHSFDCGSDDSLKKTSDRKSRSKGRPNTDALSLLAVLASVAGLVTMNPVLAAVGAGTALSHGFR